MNTTLAHTIDIQKAADLLENCEIIHTLRHGDLTVNQLKTADGQAIFLVQGCGEKFLAFSTGAV